MANRQTADGALMTAQGLDQLKSGCVPHPRSAVSAGRGQPTPIGAVGHSHVCFAVSPNNADLLPGFRIPKRKPAIETSFEEAVAVGTESHTPARGTRAGEGANRMELAYL